MKSKLVSGAYSVFCRRTVVVGWSGGFLRWEWWPQFNTKRHGAMLDKDWNRLNFFPAAGAEEAEKTRESRLRHYCKDSVSGAGKNRINLMWPDVAHPAGTGVELEHSLGQTQWTSGGYKTGTGPGEPAPTTQCGFILFEPLLEGID